MAKEISAEKIKAFTIVPREKPTLAYSGVGWEKGQLSGEGSGKGRVNLNPERLSHTGNYSNAVQKKYRSCLTKIPGMHTKANVSKTPECGQVLKKQLS